MMHLNTLVTKCVDLLKHLFILKKQWLDFLDSERVFAGSTLEFKDISSNYREVWTA